MKLKTILTTVIAVMLMTILVTAEIPQVINYQGNLTASDGTPLDGVFFIRVNIYATATGGNELWNSGFQPVNVSSGLFEMQLGVSPMPVLPDNLFSTDTTRYLGITVGSDPEISPRIKLTSASYAYQSLRADSSNYAVNANLLDGLNATDFATATDVADHIGNPSAHHTKTTDAGEITTGTLNEAVLPTNTAKLDVDQTFTGSNTFNKITYSSPRTHYFMVGGEGFLPGNNVAYSNSYANGGAYLVSGSGAMAAPIHLPQGAVVTGFKVFFYDNSTSDVTVYLGKLVLNYGGYSTLAYVSSSEVTGGYDSVIATSVSSELIDNLNYSYHVRAYSDSWDGVNMRIMGALVTYTINEAP